MNLDTDFENFKIKEDRATEVREAIQKARDNNWLHEIKNLVDSFGKKEEIESPKVEGSIGKFLKGESREVYRPAEQIQEHNIELQLRNNEYSLRSDQLVLLEFRELPKEKEFLLFFVNSNHFALIEDIMTHLKTLSDEALKEQKKRKAEFRARFKKKTK